MARSVITERALLLARGRLQVIRGAVSLLQIGRRAMMCFARTRSSLTLTCRVACIIAATGSMNPNGVPAQKLSPYVAVSPLYSWNDMSVGPELSGFGLGGELGVRWQAVPDFSVRTHLMYAHFFVSQSDYDIGPCPPEGVCYSPVGAVNIGGLALSVMLHGREEGQRGSAYLFAGPGAYVTDSRRVDADVLFGWHGGVGIEGRRAGRSLVLQLRIRQLMQVDSDGDDWPMAILTVGVRL